MRLLVLPLALVISVLVAAKPIDPAGGRIVGEWRGTSICTNRKLLPARSRNPDQLSIFQKAKAGFTAGHANHRPPFRVSFLGRQVLDDFQLGLKAKSDLQAFGWKAHAFHDRIPLTGTYPDS